MSENLSNTENSASDSFQDFDPVVKPTKIVIPNLEKPSILKMPSQTKLNIAEVDSIRDLKNITGQKRTSLNIEINSIIENLRFDKQQFKQSFTEMDKLFNSTGKKTLISRIKKLKESHKTLGLGHDKEFLPARYKPKGLFHDPRVVNAEFYTTQGYMMSKLKSSNSKKNIDSKIFETTFQPNFSKSLNKTSRIRVDPQTSMIQTEKSQYIGYNKSDLSTNLNNNTNLFVNEKSSRYETPSKYQTRFNTFESYETSALNTKYMENSDCQKKTSRLVADKNAKGQNFHKNRSNFSMPNIKHGTTNRVFNSTPEFENELNIKGFHKFLPTKTKGNFFEEIKYGYEGASQKDEAEFEDENQGNLLFQKQLDKKKKLRHLTKYNDKKFWKPSNANVLDLFGETNNFLFSKAPTKMQTGFKRAYHKPIYTSSKPKLIDQITYK